MTVVYVSKRSEYKVVSEKDNAYDQPRFKRRHSTDNIKANLVDLNPQQLSLMDVHNHTQTRLSEETL